MTITETGLFAVDHEAREIRGVLVPWGQRSRTNRSRNRPITFPRGSVRVPRDVSVVSINFDHDRFQPLGRATSIEDTETGLVATFALADTDDADAWLADRGEFVRLSAEVRNLVREDGDYGTADLTGAALVSEPAFEGAALFAVDDVDDDETDPAEAPEENGDVDDVDDETDDGVAVDEEEETPMSAPAPESMLAGAASTSIRPKAPALSRAGFVSALFHAKTSGATDALRPYMESSERTGLFALVDVKYDGVGGLVTDWPAAWLGELWQAVPEVRTFIPAFNVGQLTSLQASGWTLDVPETAVDTWAGNKAPVPSVAITTGIKEFDAIRLAGANDLAREFWDFGRIDVIDAYTRGMVAAYMKQSDDYAVAQAVAGAGAAVLGAVPTDVNPYLAALYDIVDAITAAGGTPGVLRVAPNVARSLALELDGNQLAYVAGAAGVGTGEFFGPVYRQDSRLAAGTILAADRNAFGVWELPGSPIRVDALAIANGGVDRGFFGYIAAGVIDPAAVLKATVVPA
jgi:hypothetical protein